MDAWPLAKSTSTSWTPGWAWRAFLMDCSQRWQCIPSILMRTNWSPCVSAIGVAPAQFDFRAKHMRKRGLGQQKVGRGALGQFDGGGRDSRDFLAIDCERAGPCGGLAGGFSD